MKNLFLSLYFLLAVFAVYTISAAAYIDPSIVTYIIQGVAGAAIAIGAVATIYWKKIRLFFKHRRDKKTGNGTGTE